MPRRIPDYPDAYAGWNYVASIGSLISLMSVLILIWVFFTMCYHNQNKSNLKNNVWHIEAYYTLVFNFIVNFFKTSNYSENENLLLKSKTNNSSLEFSINTPAEYHSFAQGPVMGSLFIAGFASWLIMSIATFLTYLVIGGGLGNVYTEAGGIGITLTQGLIFTFITGLIMCLLVFLLTIYNNNYSNVAINKSGISVQFLVSNWSYYSIYAVGGFMIIILPYVIEYSLIFNMTSSNLPKLIQLVNESPTIVPVENQGVLIDLSQHCSNWLMGIIINFLFYVPITVAGAVIGLKSGSIMTRIIKKFINNERYVAYISLLLIITIALVFFNILIPTIFTMDIVNWLDIKKHPLSALAIKISVRISLALFYSFGLKRVVFLLINFSLIIYNFSLRAKLTKIPAVWGIVSTIIAVVGFLIFILNDICLFIYLKGFLENISSNPPKGLAYLSSIVAEIAGVFVNLLKLFFFFEDQQITEGLQTIYPVSEPLEPYTVSMSENSNSGGNQGDKKLPDLNLNLYNPTTINHTHLPAEANPLDVSDNAVKFVKTATVTTVLAQEQSGCGAGPKDSNYSVITNFDSDFLFNSSVNDLLTQWFNNFMLMDPYNFFANMGTIEFFNNPLALFKLVKLIWIIGFKLYSLVFTESFVDTCYIFITYIKSLYDNIAGLFNKLYDIFYMVLCSLFPGSIPPLPGKTPLSLPILILLLIYMLLHIKIVSLTIDLILSIYRIFLNLILHRYPKLTKYLIKILIFDTVYNMFVNTFITLRKTDKRYKDKFDAFEYIRLFLIGVFIGSSIRKVMYIAINYGLILLINYHGYFVY